MSKIIKSQRICLNPNGLQERQFRMCLGVARFAWNWALAQWGEQYKQGKKVNECMLRKQLNSLKKPKYHWMYLVPKSVPQNAVMNLGVSFDRFIKKKSKYPRFKSKHRQSGQSARLEALRFDVYRS